MVAAGLDGCTRDELALLVREYLMAGHLIDRAGMPQVIGALGQDGMRSIAIEEWRGASPLYAKRMQRALGYEGDSVETMFKGLQLDIGSPPQFLDFRFALHDREHGEFWLDHCGALADVEPMGEDYVHVMCHDIEDPTFDATAAASNPRAQVRPVHRPPRVPADRTPVCHWTVVIADDHEAAPFPDEAAVVATTAAATLELDPIDPDEPGRHDYHGPLLSDLRLDDWSRSALRRIADEVCLQGHLLSLSFLASLRRRVASEAAVDIARRGFTGVAGVAAERLRAALGLGEDLAAAARLLELHPALHPRRYVDAQIDLTDRLLVRLDPDAPAQRDDGWMSLLHPDHVEPLDAIVRAVDPRFRCEARPGDKGGLVCEVVMDDHPAPLAGEVAVTKFSTGAEFRFGDRGTPVELRPTAR